MFLGLCAATAKGLSFLAKFIKDSLLKITTWLAEMSSKLDAAVIVALITGTVSLTGVIISSIISKIIDYRKNRQEYLAKKREEPYTGFIEMVYKLQQNIKNDNLYTAEKMTGDISRFSKSLTLWGSPRVVKNG